MKLPLVFFSFFLTSLTVLGWQPVPDHMLTSWGEKVTPENVWREYPRPAFERKQWQNLNGLWSYAITPSDIAAMQVKWDGQILVPFSLEAPLSGVGKPLTPEEALWYRREFSCKPSRHERGCYTSRPWITRPPFG